MAQLAGQQAARLCWKAVQPRGGSFIGAVQALFTGRLIPLLPAAAIRPAARA